MMSEEDAEKWTQENRSKETARPKPPSPKQDVKMAGPIDSSDEDDNHSNGEIEMALLKIGFLKISNGRLMFDANIPPYSSDSGGIIMAKVVEDGEGEPPKKKRKTNQPETDPTQSEKK